jgi:1,4-dihydroxy-2-naphthoate octaprenyltransferase
METFDDIKSIWHLEKGDQLPRVEEIEKIAKSFYMKKQNKAKTLIGVLIGCILGYIAVWIGMESVLWTTRVGLICSVMAILYVVGFKYKELMKESRAAPLNSTAFLAHLKSELIHKKEEKKRIILFILLFFVAYAFFIYEKVHVDRQLMLTGYSILALAMAFLWFILRPLTYRNYRKSIQKTITEIETIQNQINSNESSI